MESEHIGNVTSPTVRESALLQIPSVLIRSEHPAVQITMRPRSFFLGLRGVRNQSVTVATLMSWGQRPQGPHHSLALADNRWCASVATNAAATGCRSRATVPTTPPTSSAVTWSRVSRSIIGAPAATTDHQPRKVHESRSREVPWRTELHVERRRVVVVSPARIVIDV